MPVTVRIIPIPEPVKITIKPKAPPPRENYFTPEQLGALWNAEGLKPSYQRYLRFMITSPLRAGEVAELTWKQSTKSALSCGFGMATLKIPNTL